MMCSKRVKVLEKLSALRASQPEVPMVSPLDLIAAKKPMTEEGTVPVFETRTRTAVILLVNAGQQG